MFSNSISRNEIGRNAPCLCGSGIKYKKCCLGKPVSIYQRIQGVVINSGYPKILADVLCSLFTHMQEHAEVFCGGCHMTASILYVVLSELGFDVELCIGEACSPGVPPFDHSWITVDGKVVDLACSMPLPDQLENASAPVILSKDVISLENPNLRYGISTGLGFDEDARRVLARPFAEYMDAFPDDENGLWSVVLKISPIHLDINVLREKYAVVYRKVVIQDQLLQR